MTVRLSENHQHASSIGIGRPVSSPSGAAAGVGAFTDEGTPYIEDTALSKTYRGPAGVAEFWFPAGPGLKGTIASAIRKAPNYGDILRYEVWQDSKSLIDEYYIRIWVKGKVQEGAGRTNRAELEEATSATASGVGVVPLLGVGFVLLLKLIVIGALVGLTVWIIWRARNTVWGKALAGAGLAAAGGVIVIGVLALGAIYLANRASASGRRAGGG